MTYILTAALILISLLIPGTARAAEWSSRNTFDVGFTNNAYLTDTATVSDSYLQAATSNTMERDGHTLGLRLKYTDYFQESANDVLSLRLQDSWAAPWRAWKWNGALVGRLYPGGDPGTTDASFDNFGFDFGANRTHVLGSRTESEYGAGYRMRYFPSFDGRNDHNVFGHGSLDYEVSRRLTIGGLSEAGFLFSSLSEYSRAYFDFGGSVDYAVTSNWDWITDLLVTQSLFTNREITATTAVTRNRGGRASSATQAENESYTTLTFSSEILRRESDLLRWGFGLYSTSQSSKSGLQNYSALDILARLILTF